MLGEGEGINIAYRMVALTGTKIIHVTLLSFYDISVSFDMHRYLVHIETFLASKILSVAYYFQKVMKSRSYSD